MGQGAAKKCLREDAYERLSCRTDAAMLSWSSGAPRSYRGLEACLRISNCEDLTSQNAPRATIGDLVRDLVTPKSINFGISRTAA